MGTGVVRNEVLGFSLMMEMALKRNDYKGGWQYMAPSQIMNRIYDEVRELNKARKILDKGVVSFREIEAAKKEAIDVANFCMMMVDVLNQLEKQVTA